MGRLVGERLNVLQADCPFICDFLFCMLSGDQDVMLRHMATLRTSGKRVWLLSVCRWCTWATTTCPTHSCSSTSISRCCVTRPHPVSHVSSISQGGLILEPTHSALTPTFAGTVACTFSPSHHASRGRQVPRILNPVVLVLDALPGLCADAKLAAYIKSMWGGVEECRCQHCCKHVTPHCTTRWLRMIRRLQTKSCVVMPC